MNHHKANTRNLNRYNASTAAAAQNGNKENRQVNGEGLSPLKKKSPKNKKQSVNNRCEESLKLTRIEQLQILQENQRLKKQLQDAQEEIHNLKKLLLIYSKQCEAAIGNQSKSSIPKYQGYSPLQQKVEKQQSPPSIGSAYSIKDGREISFQHHTFGATTGGATMSVQTSPNFGTKKQKANLSVNVTPLQMIPSQSPLNDPLQQAKCYIRKKHRNLMNFGETPQKSCLDQTFIRMPIRPFASQSPYNVSNKYHSYNQMQQQSPISERQSYSENISNSSSSPFDQEDDLNNTTCLHPMISVQQSPQNHTLTVNHHKILAQTQQFTRSFINNLDKHNLISQSQSKKGTIHFSPFALTQNNITTTQNTSKALRVRQSLKSPSKGYFN